MAMATDERQREKIAAMLEGLTSFERKALDACQEAEEQWRLGRGNRESVKATAIRFTGVLRMRIRKREEAGENPNATYSTLAYLRRVMNHSAERFVTFNEFGCDAAAPAIEEVLA